MIKYLLVAQVEVPEKITSWEILPSDHDVSHFLDCCLSEIKGAKVSGFTCARLDGPDMTDALDRCVIVGSLP